MENHCFFCGSEKLRVTEVGISLGMSGNDYSFCFRCLKNITADKFFRKIFNEHGYKYPPKLKTNNEV